jgi:hypothetical protein
VAANSESIGAVSVAMRTAGLNAIVTAGDLSCEGRAEPTENLMKGKSPMCEGSVGDGDAREFAIAVLLPWGIHLPKS